MDADPPPGEPALDPPGAEHAPGADINLPPDLLPPNNQGEDYVYEQYHAALTHAVGVHYSVGVPRLEGADRLSRPELLLLRTVFTYMLSLPRSYMSYITTRMLPALSGRPVPQFCGRTLGGRPDDPLVSPGGRYGAALAHAGRPHAVTTSWLTHRGRQRDDLSRGQVTRMGRCE